MPTSVATFGELLRSLRKRAGMTQSDLAAAVGYSVSSISALEKGQHLPDVEFVVQHFVPALVVEDEPHLAAQLVELAAAARGERPPAFVTVQQTAHVVIQEEVVEGTGRLPAPPTDLIGRAAEVNQLCNRLLGHHGRLLTLVGPPGIGKTTLALAARLPHFYADGVVFVALAAVGDAVLMAATIAAAAGSSDASPKPPKTKLIEFLRRKTMLLVLDNLEQIGDAGPLIAALVTECPGLYVLATSRERLHLRAEQRFKVPPLDRAAAVALFTQRAAAVEADFVLTAANQSTIEAICQRLDCLPLAIELCAAQIDLLSPTQLLAHLHERGLDLLVEGAHDLPPRQRTLRTAIHHSYALLAEEERTLFRSLGVLVGGFDLPVVEAVSAWRQETSTRSLLSTLHALIDKSLMRAETLPSGEQRYLLLETIREFALEQVRAHGEEAELRQRHYLAYLHLFRTGDGQLRGAEATRWFARLEPEQDNLRAALQWTLDAARHADTAWLLIAANYFWAINGHRYEVARWIARLLPYRQTLAVDQRLALLIDFVVPAGESGEFPDLDQYRAEIIALMAICPSKQLQAVAWHFLAESDAEAARAYALARAASEAPELGPEFGDYADHDFTLAGIQVGYASSLLHQGEVAQAAMLVTDSLQRFRRRGNQEFIAECLGHLGNYALVRGNISEAYAHLQEAMVIGTTHNLRIVHAEWQWLLGLVTLYGGNATEARRLLEECLPLCLEIKNTFHLAQVCMCLAETALWEGDLEQAAGWLGQSLAYHASPQRITAAELQRLFIAGRLATAQGQYVRAAILFGLADAAHRHLHHIYAGPMLPLVNAALTTVRESLDPKVFDQAFATGQQLSLEEAFAGILRGE